MSEMIERVARGIIKSGGFLEDAETLRFARDYARAAIEAMKEPTVEMVAAAFPCGANEAFSHEDKCLGAAACLKIGGAADIGLLEGEAVKQAAFLARDYRLMIDQALKEPA
jgi:hypothetical protein